MREKTFPNGWFLLCEWVGLLHPGGWALTFSIEHLWTQTLSSQKLSCRVPRLCCWLFSGRQSSGFFGIAWYRWTSVRVSIVDLWRTVKLEREAPVGSDAWAGLGQAEAECSLKSRSRWTGNRFLLASVELQDRQWSDGRPRTMDAAKSCFAHGLGVPEDLRWLTR